MGLLDSVIGALGQGGSGGGQADLINAVIGMLGKDSPIGGLAGLVARLQQGGLGDAVGSWVSTGQNLPVSPEQLGGALGDDFLGPLARQLGMGQGDVAGQLSQILPQIVDRVTPQGQLPQGGLPDLGQLGNLLGGLLGPR